MTDWLPSLARIAPWHWWILGALLLLLELWLPGVLFVYLAVAAFAVGLLVFVLPLPVGAQLLLFALLGVLSVYLGRRFVGRLQQSPDPDAAFLNRRGASWVGREVVVAEPIRQGFGRVHVADSVWRARGPDAPAGSVVRVVGVDGTTLVVEASVSGADAIGERVG